MVTKLKSVLGLTRLQSLLLVKAVVFALGLAYLARGGFAIFPTIIFCLLSAVFYLQPVFKTFSLLASFLALLILAILVTKGFLGAIPLWLMAGAFGTLFYMLLGIKNLNFVNRQLVYSILHVVLFYLLFVLFFSADKVVGFFGISIAVFIATLILFSEAFRLAEITDAKKRRIFIWVIGFLLFEIIWAIGLLPIGFVNLSGLAIIVTFIFEDFSIRYLKNELNKELVKKRLALFSVLILLIFSASDWSL